MKRCKLEIQIDITRNELYELSKRGMNLTDPLLLSKSEQLDQLINEYQKLMMDAESYLKTQKI
ncbi:Spo0E family sporulation regulatory protein-aspartic acid phosphatase [Fictibacillus barbaricus]